MELRDFVAESLRQVVEGVAKAAETAAGHGAYVNPPDKNHHAGRASVVVPGGGGVTRPLQMVEFDVAVVVTRDSKSEVGGGVSVVSVASAEGSHQRGEGRETTTRIRFSVPVAFPLQEAAIRGPAPRPPAGPQSPPGPSTPPGV